MEQRSQDWKSWRREGIGASDVSAILHLIPELKHMASPWMTPFQLWEIKTGKREGFQGNWATDRGNRLEGPARARFEVEMMKEFGELLDFEPATLVHPVHPICRASLDGWYEPGRFTLEIKCPGEKDHETAKKGLVPTKYQPQVQYQMAVARADMAYYYSFNGDSGVVVKVLPDLTFQDRLLHLAEDFWNVYVLEDTPPPLTDKDAKSVRDPELAKICETYRDLHKESERIKQEMDSVKEQLRIRFREKEHPKIECNGLVYTRGYRRGTVDYSKIPELQAIDLEQYRKPSAEFSEIRLKSLEKAKNL